MNRQPPATESDQGRSGLLETVEARFAEADAARSAWLDDRIRERRGRGRAACAGCGLKSGHHPGCAYRERVADSTRG
jgi:hypothetical protein